MIQEERIMRCVLLLLLFCCCCWWWCLLVLHADGRKWDNYNGRVKLAGNKPLMVVPSFWPISHPSSFECERRWATKMSDKRYRKRIRKKIRVRNLHEIQFVWHNRKSATIVIYLIIRVIVFDDIDHFAHLEAKFIRIFFNIFVCCLYSIQNARRQIGCCCAYIGYTSNKNGVWIQI